MKFLVVLIAFVMSGIVYCQHNNHDHGHGHGHGGEEHGACRHPVGNNPCDYDGDCNLSLCSGECSPICDNGNCMCQEQHSNTACTTVANCTVACHPDQIPYCHEVCHCHQQVECQSSEDCSCRRKTNKIPVCDPDLDNPGHKHCHCI